jgi:hypothetical protein
MGGLYHDGMTTWTRTAPHLTEVKGNALNYMVYTYVWSDGDGDGGEIRFDLSAPYQRGSVWTVEMRQRLIRSLLHGIVPGTVYLSKTPWRRGDAASHRVIDGKQRIETVQAFSRGEFAVPADWWPDTELDLDAVPDDGMVTIDHLSARGRSRFEHSTLPAVEVDLTMEWTKVPAGTGTTGSAKQFNIRDRTDDEILAAEAEVYLLVNTGGISHTTADLATAIDLTERTPS